MVSVVFSDAGRANLKKLGTIIANNLKESNAITLIFDCDGTLFSFCDNPSKVVMDNGCCQAIRGFLEKDNVRVVALTGRALPAAEKMLEGLNIEIVGSHGAEFKDKDGEIQRFYFTQEQTVALEGLVAKVKELQSEYPNIHIEVDKFGSVGVNMSAYRGNDSIRQEVFSLFERTKTEDFSVAYEGRQSDDMGWEVELRPAEYLCGKHIGISYFIRPDKNGLVIFFGDSYGDHGTDTPAAILVKDRQQFPNGYAVMVMNGRNVVPSQEAPQHPDFIFKNPENLGSVLLSTLHQDPTRLLPPDPKGP